MKTEVNKKYLFWVIAFSLPLALAVGSITYYATSWGPVAYSDSVSYLMSARNLLDGNGLGIIYGDGKFNPMTDHPPLYTFLLAFGGLFKFSLIDVARWIGIIGSGFTVLGIGFASYILTRRISFSFMITLFWASPPLIIISLFSLAMSEVLLYPLLLSSLFLTLLFIEKGQKWQLVLGAILAGLASVTHVVAIPFIITSVIGILFLSDAKLTKRVKNSIYYGFLSLSIVAIWFGYIGFIDRSLAGRVLVFKGGWWQYLAPFRAALISFSWSKLPILNLLNINNYNTQKTILLILFLVMAALVFITVVKKIKHGEEINRDFFFRWGVFFGLGVVFFLLYLTVIYLFVTPAQGIQIPQFPFNDRIFSYIYFGTAFSLFGFIYFIAGSHSVLRWCKVVPILCIIGLFVKFAPISVEDIRSLHADGRGYLSKDWVTSPVLKALNELPLETAIVTNEADAVLLLTKRRPYVILETQTGTPVTVFTRFGDGNTESDIVFREDRAALVLFPSIHNQFFTIYGDLGERRLYAFIDNLVNYKNCGNDSGIYYYK